MIYHLLNEQKKKGTAVIYVGEDLDVLIALSDRVAVIGDGEVRGIVDARKTNKNEIGLLMTKKNDKEEKKNA
jgi:simple sugar transport system ATP-binding protein